MNQNRKTPVVPQADLAAQAQLCHRIAEYWQAQGRVPVAYVETYGCQQNEADSQQIQGMLARCGYVFGQSAQGADLVVFNTCAIREHAEQRVFGNLGALTHTKRNHPAQKILVCGCMAGRPEVVQRLRKSYPHVDGVFSTSHLWQLPELLWQLLSTGKRVFFTRDEPGAIAEGLPMRRDNPLKAWVSVMYGCNNFCSYCIVPYVRGRERSREPEDILAECRQLVAQGYRDITLLGQNVNAYGKDLGRGIDFADLLTQIGEIPGDFLIRFMTSHPKDAGPKLFAAMASSPKIAKHLHLPVQCGSDRVLKAMNRHYDREKYLSLVACARAYMPDLVLTSDIIVGFPGETREEFDQTLSLLEQVCYDALFTFIFSPRPGTPAANMPDPVSRAEKNQWFDQLCALQNRISEEKHRAYVGKRLRVLVDGREEGCLTARTQGGRLVRLPDHPALIGRFVQVEITGSTTWSLTGKPVE